MKRFILIGLGLLLVQIAFSQAEMLDERLLSRFTESQISHWSETYPQKLQFKIFELDNGFEIITVDESKLEGIEQLHFYDYLNKEMGMEVQNIDELNFNLYQYYYERAFTHSNYYRIGDTNNILIIYSEKVLAEKFNKDSSHE